ncbi:MAG: protoporphyrinogen oxidase, partial [Proteobacteria bacterium]|nr:protoporphyrinogen oxidase [Desulfobulbaceae bacterium]MBU4154262.1 protoporphyrinogen oxidase [Pseudomonadota bacterium]
AAHFVKGLSPDLTTLILEKSARVGGAVQTFRQAGFQGEWGPHGFLDNTAESQELLHDTGLYQEAQAAPLGDFYRYVCHGGALVRLPQSLKTVLTTPLISSLGKLRVLADLWKSPRSEAMTIGEWVEYRFGPDLLPLVDAAVTGSFAGDYSKLCIDAVMPGVRKLEMEAGSVIRGLIRKKKSGGDKLTRLPSMLNFPEGMERLIKVLTSQHEVECNTLVQGLSKDLDGWRIQTDKGQIAARAVVMAVPVNQCLQLLAAIKPPPVSCVPVSKIINVVLGFSASAKVPYGFGYLAPEREGRFTLGAMFTSHMFPDRAPAGQVLIEALVGGRRHPDRLILSDEEIVDKVCADISQLIELPEPPIFVKVLRPEHGIPQLEMDHPRLLGWRQAMEQDFPGLYICGFGWDGIGMNDMIKSAKKTAMAIAVGGSRIEDEAKVKPVYF